MMLQSKIILFLISLILGTVFLTAEEEDREKINSIIGYGDALVLGLVEGITEFLPISSTGHLIIIKEQMMDPSSMDASQEEAVDAYLIVIQAGAILAVTLLYARRISTILLGFLGLDPKGKRLGINILAAFAPAAALGPFLDSWIESYLFGSVPVAISLILGAGLMHWAEKRKRISDGADLGSGKNLNELNIRNCLVVGLLQCVAMCPGTSRSMMTIVGGYLVGLSRGQAAEFSFLLGLVTLTAAAAYKGLTKGETLLANLEYGPMFFGCLVAGVAAAFSVRWLVGYLARKGLGLFVWYRLVLGLLILSMCVEF